MSKRDALDYIQRCCLGVITTNGTEVSVYGNVRASVKVDCKDRVMSVR